MWSDATDILTAFSILMWQFWWIDLVLIHLLVWRERRKTKRWVYLAEEAVRNERRASESVPRP